MKLIIRLIITFILLIPQMSLANEVIIEVYGVPKIAQGGTFEFLAKILPTSELSLEEIEKNFTVLFKKHIEVTKVNSLRRSDNNKDVALLLAEGILLDDLNKIKGILLESKIELKLTNYEYGGDTKAQQNYLLFEQKKGNIIEKFEFKLIYFIYILTAIVILIILFIFIRRYMLLKKEKQFLKKEKREWIQKVSDYNIREQFELVYQEKKSWLKCFDLEGSPLTKEFFAYMETHQYKQTWTTKEEENAREIFARLLDVIRKEVV